MKKVLIILLVVSMLFITGCSTKNEEEKSREDRPAGEERRQDGEKKQRDGDGALEIQDLGFEFKEM